MQSSARERGQTGTSGRLFFLNIDFEETIIKKSVILIKVTPVLVLRVANATICL